MQAGLAGEAEGQTCYSARWSRGKHTRCLSFRQNSHLLKFSFAPCLPDRAGMDTCRVSMSSHVVRSERTMFCEEFLQRNEPGRPRALDRPAMGVGNGEQALHSQRPTPPQARSNTNHARHALDRTLVCHVRRLSLGFDPSLFERRPEKRPRASGCMVRKPWAVVSGARKCALGGDLTSLSDWTSPDITNYLIQVPN